MVLSMRDKTNDVMIKIGYKPIKHLKISAGSGKAVNSCLSINPMLFKGYVGLLSSGTFSIMVIPEAADWAV